MKRKACDTHLSSLYDDAFAHMVSFLSPIGIRCLGETSHTLQDRLNHKRLASRTMLTQLRRTMERSLGLSLPRPWPWGVYLSGSLLYHTLSGATSWTPNDVDFFVPNLRLVVRQAQRWLVDAGFRIVRCGMTREYGSMEIAGIIHWRSGTWEPNANIPKSWADGGLYSDALHGMGADTSPEWVPACDSRQKSLGIDVQLVVMNEVPADWLQLLQFDMPILENVFDGKGIHVAFPEDVLQGHTRFRKHAHNLRLEHRSAQRIARYRARGVIVDV